MTLVNLILPLPLVPRGEKVVYGSSVEFSPVGVVPLAVISVVVLSLAIVLFSVMLAGSSWNMETG